MQRGRLHSSLRSYTRTKELPTVTYFRLSDPRREDVHTGAESVVCRSVALVINGTDMGKTWSTLLLYRKMVNFIHHNNSNTVAR